MKAIPADSTRLAWAPTGLIVVMLAVSCDAPAAQAPLRIMPLGDSITAGYTDNPNWNVPFEFGYRSGLATRLSNADYRFEFVGNSQEPFNNRFGDPTHGDTVRPEFDLRPLGQDQHNGYGGISIRGIRSGVSEWIATDHPDVILLLIGINGINARSPSQLDTLVTTIFGADPNVSLIVAQITPYGVYNQDLYDYNTHIRDTLVPTHARNGFKISTVDLYSLFLTDPDDPTSIGAGLHSNPPHNNHPTEVMYDQMAAAWFAGIESVAVPEPSTLALASFFVTVAALSRRCQRSSLTGS